MVSVIIPTYNRAETIKRSIMSALNQTYKDIEVLVVDDGSTDCTKEIVADIKDERLRYIYQDHVNGNVARNNGIQNAKGDYIAFLDSDDEWRKEKLETQIAIMENVGAEMSFHDNLQHNYGSNTEKKCETIPGLQEGFVPYEKLVQTAIYPITIVAKTSIFRATGYNENLKRMQGYEWEIRAGQIADFYYIPIILSDYYIQSDSITMGGAKKLEEAAQFILDSHKDLCEKTPTIEDYLLRIIIGSKIRLHEPVKKDCRRLYNVNKCSKNFIRYTLALTGLIYPLNRLVD